MPHLLLLTLFLLLPSMAHAYIGPGAGITAIGTLIALIGAAALAILGFIWYPIKRLRRSRSRKTASAGAKEKGTVDGS